MRTTTIIGVSVHLADDAECVVEFVEAHGSVEEDYYRVKFGECTVFMNRTQLADLYNRAFVACVA